MDLLTVPTATAFDAVSSLASAGIYMIVALAALAHAPRDPRVRVFFATAAAGVVPYCVTAQIWAHGAGRTFSMRTSILLAFSLMIGSLALFHFTQVFPWRRPWIRTHGGKLPIAYLAVALLAVVAAVLLPALDFTSIGEIHNVPDQSDAIVALGLAAILIPIVFVLGVVVPFGGLLSLYNSWRAARAHGVDSARVTTWWMLVSQMGGGVLTILIIPLLRLVASSGPWVAIAAALLFGSAVLMPVAFAVGVWKLGVLELDIDGLPQ